MYFVRLNKIIMRILSIDVGIRNLSFCLFCKESSHFIIEKWDNIDLTEKIESKCVHIDKSGLCDKPAKFIKEDKSYCLKHAKKQDYLMPNCELKSSYLNKQKISSLIELAEKYKIAYEKSPKRSQLLYLLLNFANTHCLEPIMKTNAAKMDLVTIGKNIQHKFDELFTSNIDIVIIENQIGPLANKMKTIQGMLSQYFIMKNNNVQIDFISASNKLKDFIKKDNKTNKEDKIDYKQRKKLGITTCLEIIKTDSRFNNWDNFLDKHKKKDDLSDCFLQGLWYINNRI